MQMTRIKLIGADAFLFEFAEMYFRVKKCLFDNKILLL